MQELLAPCLKRAVDAVKKRRGLTSFKQHPRQCVGRSWRRLSPQASTALHPFATEETDGHHHRSKGFFGRKIAVGRKHQPPICSPGHRGKKWSGSPVETLANNSVDGGFILTASSSIYSGVNPDKLPGPWWKTVYRYGWYR